MSSPPRMAPPELEIEGSGEPYLVWPVGHAPDPWAWTSWDYADDEGLFGGRWDDQLGEFRTIYTANSLLGCLLELLAHFRPCRELLVELDQIEDDDGSIGNQPEAPEGAVGHTWLEGRVYGSALQRGRYCFITHSRSIATLITRYPLHEHGLTPADVDTALLKDAGNRLLTRNIARWVYDRNDGTSPIDGIRFNSRHGDEIRVWAVFERAGDPPRPQLVEPSDETSGIGSDLPELLEAFTRFGLHWHEG